MTRSEFLLTLASVLAFGAAARADVAPESEDEIMGLFLEMRGNEAVLTRAPPPRSAAAIAGLTRNDVVLALDRTPIAQVPRRQFQRLGWGFSYDCIVRIRRGGRVIDVRLRRQNG
jgi:hypothetical protein